jgi:hypothetical protein
MCAGILDQVAGGVRDLRIGYGGYHHNRGLKYFTNIYSTVLRDPYVKSVFVDFRHGWNDLKDVKMLLRIFGTFRKDRPDIDCRIRARLDKDCPDDVKKLLDEFGVRSDRTTLGPFKFNSSDDVNRVFKNCLLYTSDAADDM